MDDSAQTQTPDDTTESPDDATPTAGDALQLLDLERTIKTFYAGIVSKREELKKLKEMIDDTLENDATYAEHTELLNEAKRVLKGTRDQLMSVGSVMSTLEDMKELRNDIKELQTHLSDNILRYYDVAQTDHITMDDGQTYVIRTTAKLVKESTAYKP